MAVDMNQAATKRDIEDILTELRGFMGMVSHQTERAYTWLKQLAEKVGVELKT